MNTGVNDAPRAACAAAGAVHCERVSAVPGGESAGRGTGTNAVELTPRGLELLETLNELFDRLASSTAAAAGNETVTGEQP